MIQEEQKIKAILLKEGYVAEEEIRKAEAYAKANNVSLAEYLVMEDLITKDSLGQAMAKAYKLN